jgi:hypothetical protein
MSGAEERRMRLDGIAVSCNCGWTYHGSVPWVQMTNHAAEHVEENGENVTIEAVA